MAETKKSWKNQLICMDCGAESLGKSVKECNKTFPGCRKDGGPIKDSCRTTILQDGKPIVKVLQMAEYEKLLRVYTKVTEAEAQADAKAKAKIPVKEETPKNTKQATKL